jgi:hypothetical protein
MEVIHSDVSVVPGQSIDALLESDKHPAKSPTTSQIAIRSQSSSKVQHALHH